MITAQLGLTCQAADEPLLSVLVEQVRAEDQLQTLVTRLSSTSRQHLIEQSHLLVTNPTDTCQSVFDQTQDFSEGVKYIRISSLFHGNNFVIFPIFSI